MPEISQRLKYTPSDLTSYIRTCEQLKDHPYFKAHHEVLIPLRGGFMFAFVSNQLHGTPLIERTHFMPASEFLFEAGNVTRIFMKNYIHSHISRYAKKGLFNILLLDEAKSGRAVSNLYRRFQDVLYSLK